MNYILLMPNIHLYGIQYVQSDHLSFENLYRNPNPSIIVRILRKTLYLTGAKLQGIFYGEWKNHLDDKDTQFIVFDSCRPYKRLRNFIKNAANIPIVYCWNSIDGNQRSIEKLKKDFRVFSYSQIDCEQYELEFAPQFLPYSNPLLEMSSEYDGFFVGRDKGRLPVLEKLYQCFEHPFFYVLQDHKPSSSSELQFQERLLEYTDYLSYMAKSEVIIEILPSPNADFTMRTIEAIFYQKKLITDNKNIAKEPFYNENNILIIDGNVDENAVKEFMQKPFVRYPTEITHQYTLEGWIENFK